MTNKINEYIRIWDNLIKSNIPLLLVGGTGIGKTEIIREISKNQGRDCLFLHLARNSNTDFLIPLVEDGLIKTAVSENLKKLERGNINLFLDEYDRADAMTRNAILSLINERVFDGIRIPESVGIVLAGNQELSRDTNLLNQAELTRVALFRLDDFVKDKDYLEYWLEIAVNKLDCDSRITSFILQYPEMLYMPSEEVEQMATPRGWINLSRGMGNLEQITDKILRHTFISSFVGEKASAKFQAYYELYAKMPSAEELLSNFDKYKIESIDAKLASIDIFLQYLRSGKKALANLDKVVNLIHEKMGDELLYAFILLGKNYKDFVKELFAINSKNEKIRNIISEIAKAVR